MSPAAKYTLPVPTAAPSLRPPLYASESEPGRAALQADTDAASQRVAVRADLMRHFMRETQFRQRVGSLLMVVFVAFCWRHGEQPLLLLWLAGGLSVLGIRSLLEARYREPGAFESLAAQQAFVSTMVPVYMAQGAVWGVSLLFYFDRIPVYDQFGCWLILACVASAPMTSVSLVPTLLRAYTHTLFAALMAGLVYTVFEHVPGPDPLNYLFLALPVFHWWLLQWFGKGIYETHRAQYELQYDLARKEQEARAAVELKNRFLAAATHDMRQPVTALSLYAEHLVAYPEMHVELAPKIAAATMATNRLFDSLFDLANLHSGHVSLRLQPVDIADVLAELQVQFEPLAHARQLRLRVRGLYGADGVDGARALLHSDPVCVRRMIGNVLGNAIKYSPPGKDILLTASARRGHVRVEVWDQGYGIPADEIDKVFEEFYRVDRGGSHDVDGMGLGLSIVTRLAHLLHAQVAIASVEGRGTRFTMRLHDVPGAGALPRGI